MNDAVKDPEILEALYWHEDLSMWQIAERLDCSETTVYRYMTQYGIDRRAAAARKTGLSRYSRYRVDGDGYPIWSANQNTDGASSVRVHQLLAIAEGCDPHKIFSGGDWHVHHKNGIKFDNRPTNIELLTASEHRLKHVEAGDAVSGDDHGRPQKYTDQEAIEWLELFAAEFGYVPKVKDIVGWPGPSGETYRRQFGSWDAALEAAGLVERADGERPEGEA